jgi:hypothetical protein
MANVRVMDTPTLTALGQISSEHAWLPQGLDEDASTILRYIMVGGIWYWIPDVTYTKA